MTTTVVRKVYPTLVTVNGVTSETSLEELSLLAIEGYIETGSFESIKQLPIMVPVQAKIIGTKEIFLEQYNNDFILVEHDLNTGNFLFGPINEKTASLAMREVNDGAPVYRNIMFGDLNIVNEEVLTMIDEAKESLPSYTGKFTVRHTVRVGSKRNKRDHVEIEEHTLSSLFYLLRQSSHKALPYYDIFTSRGQKPATLETALKRLKNDESGKHYIIDLVSAKSIKDLDNVKFILTATGDSNTICNLFIEGLEFLPKTLSKGEKLYITNIREKDCNMSDFVSKNELRMVKQLFDKLPQRVNMAKKSLECKIN